MPLTLAALLFATSALAESCGQATKTGTAASATTTPGASAPSATSPTPGGSKTSQTPGSAGSSSTTTPSGAGGAKSAHSKARFTLPPAGAHRAPSLSASERSQLPVSDIALSSPVIKRRVGAPTTLAATYTCHGADSSLPLRWSGVPAGTRELVLFAMNSQPVAGKLFFDWAIAGLNPALHGLQAGQTPAGAIQGHNSHGTNGYTLCPPSNTQETYVFVLYAIPTTLNAKPGFDPATLRKQAMQTSRHTGLLAVTND